ncbi:MAG: histidine kinase [Bacteroidota bacterium]
MLDPTKGLIFTFEEWTALLFLLVGILLFRKPISRIIDRLNQSYPWISAGKRRILIQLAVVLLGASAISLVFYVPSSLYINKYGVPAFYQNILDKKAELNALDDHLEEPRHRPKDEWELSDFMIGVAEVSFFCLLLIFVVEETFGYLHRQSLKKLELQTLLKEQAQLKASVLKKQLDPHFMFNTLNVLSGLIYQDVDKAAQFIKELSTVYRYVLEQSEELVSTIEQEFKFLDSYLYLLKIRFDNKIPVSIHIPPDRNDWLIPSMTLELLVENAIKHNVFDREQPLYLNFSVENDQLIVKNNLQLRGSSTESLGLGLSNLKKRLELLSIQDYRFSVEGEDFVAVVPLINPEDV